MDNPLRCGLHFPHIIPHSPASLRLHIQHRLQPHPGSDSQRPVAHVFPPVQRDTRSAIRVAAQKLQTTFRYKGSLACSVHNCSNCVGAVRLSPSRVDD